MTTKATKKPVVRTPRPKGKSEMGIVHDPAVGSGGMANGGLAVLSKNALALMQMVDQATEVPAKRKPGRPRKDSDAPVEVKDELRRVRESTWVPRQVLYDVDNRWFKNKLADQGKSIRDVATAIKMDATALSLTLLGKRKMSVAEAGKIADQLGEPVDEVMRRAGVEIMVGRAGTVFLVGSVDLDSDVSFGGVMGPPSVVSPEPGSELKAIRVHADGPFDGWVLFYKEARGMAPEAVDRLCIVTTKEAPGSARVGWVRKAYEMGKWTFAPLVPGNPEKVCQIVTASPILWMKQ